MVFFYEPGDSFPLLTVLQMGRNYEHNEVGYVYVYSPNGNEEGSMNQLVMFRVPKDSILDRSAYEFFISLNSDGTGSWSRDISCEGGRSHLSDRMGETPDFTLTHGIPAWCTTHPWGRT